MAGYNERLHFRCKGRCPGGKDCYCETWTGSTHNAHMCSDPDCVCHSRKRYEKPKADQSTTIAVIGKPGHTIRLAQYTGKTGFQPLKPKDLSYNEWHDLQRVKGEEKIPSFVAPGLFGSAEEHEQYKRMTDENGEWQLTRMETMVNG